MDHQHAPKLELNQLCDQAASLCFETSSTKQTMDDQHPPKLGLNQLCETCVDNIFPKDREWQWLEKGFSGKPEEEKLIGPFTLKRLLEAVKAGCHFCTIVSDSIRKMEDLLRPRGYGDLWGTQERYFLVPHDSTGKSAWFEVDFRLGFGGIKRHDFSIDVYPATVLNQDGPYQYSISRHGTLVQNKSYTNLSEQSFDQVRHWLQLCQQTHTMCNAKSGFEPDSELLPVRFVDLGADATHPVRLVDRQLTEANKPVYITLSYRWTAQIEKSQTTQANKHIHYEAIPVSQWPQVYKDAASLARRLGVRYIWIDALCIIQGDHKDWDEQSQMMDMVYTNGFLNLAAILGEESPGLECSRNPLGIMPCVLPRVSSKANGAEGISHWLIQMRVGFEYFVPQAPLYKRGWTLQERILSTRTLHCGKQLYWECMTSKAPETFPSLHVKDRKRLYTTTANPVEGLKTVLSDPNLFRDFRSEEPSHLTFIDIWCKIVAEFSTMSFTKPSDRLVALRGIVHRLQDLLEDAEVVSHYASGLWKIGNLFEQQLCWHVWKNTTPLGRKSDHELAKHFPSWSWAAVGNRVYFPITFKGSKVRKLAKVEFLHGSDDNATDPVGGASIGLRGVLIPFINAETILIDGRKQPVVSCTVQVPLENNSRSTSLWVRLETKTHPDRPMTEETKKKEIEMLPLHYQINNPTWGQWQYEAQIYGLLLESVGTHPELPVYRRLGMFEATYKTAYKLNDLDDTWLKKAIESGRLLFGATEADLTKVIEVDDLGELNYENRHLAWFFRRGNTDEEVDGIPKEIHEKLLTEPLIYLK